MSKRVLVLDSVESMCKRQSEQQKEVRQDFLNNDDRRHVKMTEKEAIESYEELAYDLAKAVSKLAFIKERMAFINAQMDWDGMAEMAFEDALAKLSDVQATATIYMLESKFRDRDIENHKLEAKALEDAKKKDA